MEDLGHLIQHLQALIAHLQDRVWRIEQLITYNPEVFRIPPCLKQQRIKQDEQLIKESRDLFRPVRGPRRVSDFLQDDD